MRILIIGSSGMLGYVTFRYLQSQGHQVTGITHTKRFSGMVQMDVTDELTLKRFLEQMSFNTIINCAALLVKPSQEHQSKAIKLNTWLPHFLDEYCIWQNTYLIQVSTDGVFSGKSGGYKENDVCSADTFYGKSKFLGEINSNHALTIRSGFWGVDINSSGSGLFQWFMRQQGTVSGYSKAMFNGVSNLEFAEFVNSAIEKRWTGLYHLCASEIVSKYDFLCLQKQIFYTKANILPNENVQIDRSLICTRNDVQYQQKSFEYMMRMLKEWTMKEF